MPSVKTSLAEWIAFVEEPWPKGQYVNESIVLIGDATEGDEDRDFDVEYLSTLSPDTPITIVGGEVRSEDSGHSFEELTTKFKRWRAQSNTVFAAIAVPKDKVDAVAAALEAVGIKVPKALQPVAKTDAPSPGPRTR